MSPRHSGGWASISKHDEISQIRREEKTIDRFFVLTSFEHELRHERGQVHGSNPVCELDACLRDIGQATKGVW